MCTVYAVFYESFMRKYRYRVFYKNIGIHRLASVGILGKGRKLGKGKLGWHDNFDKGFERDFFFDILGFNS